MNLKKNTLLSNSKKESYIKWLKKWGNMILNSWFTIEEIDDTTFAISEYGHWEKAHSYLLIGSEAALLIDTGLGIGNIKKEIDKLTTLPIKVITTHAHWDHIGGHSMFENIYVHEKDAEWLRKGLPIPISVIKSNVIREPFSKIPPKEFDIDNYTVYNDPNVNSLRDNDIIDIGLRKVRILHTPGHSPGHICIMEEERGYLYTGDLMYLGTLYAFYPSTSPIDFKQSVDKIGQLKNITRILPGHNDLAIPNEIIEKVQDAFSYIEKKGLLAQGSGIFEFEGFKIQL